MLSLKRTDGKTSPNRQNEKDVRFENIPTAVWRFQTTSVRLMGKQPEAGDRENAGTRCPEIRPTLGLQRMWLSGLKYCVSWLLLSLHVKIENRRIIGEMFETLQSNCIFFVNRCCNTVMTQWKQKAACTFKNQSAGCFLRFQTTSIRHRIRYHLVLSKKSIPHSLNRL